MFWEALATVSHLGGWRDGSVLLQKVWGGSQPPRAAVLGDLVPSFDILCPQMHLSLLFSVLDVSTLLMTPDHSICFVSRHRLLCLTLCWGVSPTGLVAGARRVRAFWCCLLAPIDGCSAAFQFLAVTNKAVMDIYVCIFVNVSQTCEACFNKVLRWDWGYESYILLQVAKSLSRVGGCSQEPSWQFVLVSSLPFP